MNEEDKRCQVGVNGEYCGVSESRILIKLESSEGFRRGDLVTPSVVKVLVAGDRNIQDSVPGLCVSWVWIYFYDK